MILNSFCLRRIGTKCLGNLKIRPRLSNNFHSALQNIYKHLLSWFSEQASETRQFCPQLTDLLKYKRNQTTCSKPYLNPYIRADLGIEVRSSDSYLWWFSRAYYWALHFKSKMCVSLTDSISIRAETLEPDCLISILPQTTLFLSCLCL